MSAHSGVTHKEIQRLTSLELVAAYSYSPTKVGCDVGEVVGIGKLGVAITSSRADLIAERPDAVLYVPMDFGGWGADEDLLALLGAGINVVTSLPYRGLRWRDDGSYELFDKTAKEGGATFYVTGVNPDFVCERWVLGLTGLCDEIDHIRVTEIFRADTAGQQGFDMCGFGGPIDSVKENTVLSDYLVRYFEPSMRVIAERMGRPLDTVKGSNVGIAADHDVELPFATLSAGTLASIVARCEGYVDGRVFIPLRASITAARVNDQTTRLRTNAGSLR